MREDPRAPRKPWRWVALAVGLVLLIPVGWLAGHRLRSRELPPAPWTSRDLPPIPDALTNGLDDVIMPSATRRITPADRDLTALVDTLDTEPPARRWASVQAKAAELTRFMEHDTPGSLRVRERDMQHIDAALAAPRFSDPCASVDSDCRMLEVMNLVRVASIADYETALRGDWPSAFSRGSRLVIASKKMLLSARTILAHMVAIQLQRLATDHLRVLFAGLRQSGAEPWAIRNAVAFIERALGTMRREEVHARRGIIAECLWFRSALASELASPTSGGVIGGPIGPYMIDAHGTIALSDKTFVDVMRWAAAADHRRHAPPVVPTHAAGLGWWLWNPGGKALLDIGVPDVPRLVLRFDDQADALFVSRDALRREVLE